MSRQSDYMTWDLPNPLPNDGYPRMTTEGFEILKEGLREGNFDRWCDSIGNHSRSIGHDKCRNLYISCDPKTNHFQCTIWFGQSPPTIEYMPIAPTYEFNIIDTRRGMALPTGYQELPPEGYFALRNSKDDWFTTSVMILLNDYGMDARRRTYYKTSTVQSDIEDDDDDTEECAQATAPVKVRSLEAWL